MSSSISEAGAERISFGVACFENSLSVATAVFSSRVLCERTVDTSTLNGSSEDTTGASPECFLISRTMSSMSIRRRARTD